MPQNTQISPALYCGRNYLDAMIPSKYTTGRTIPEVIEKKLTHLEKQEGMKINTLMIGYKRDGKDP